MAQIFVSPWAQYVDASGNPGSGYKLYFYQTGTTTPITIYSDVGLTTPQANPVIADSAGQWTAVYMAEQTYKVVMATAADITVRTVDPAFAGSNGIAGNPITSASAITVPDVGDYFHITGNTTINTLSTRAAGTEITLVFDSNPQLTNSSSIILPNGVNILTHVGYTATFRSEGSGNWRWVSGGPKIPFTVIKVTTSGTTVDTTGLPTGLRRVTIVWEGVSTSGTSPVIIQLGNATTGGFLAAGYVGASTTLSTTATSTAGLTSGFPMAGVLAASARNGVLVLNMPNGAQQSVIVATGSSSDGSSIQGLITGELAMSGVLDRIRFTTAGGTDTFDGGYYSLELE